MQNVDKFICPICKSLLHIENKSLICEKRHCYDVSKDGYVNFFIKSSNTKYDSKNILARRNILELGFYDNILFKIKEIIKNINAKKILDAGCGEGYFIRNIGKNNFACDISKYAIQKAAKIDKDNVYFVADNSNIPLIDKSIDCILNIFAPANYKEFKRISNYMIKVVPNEDHIIELRNLIKKHAKNSDDVEELVHQKTEVISRFSIKNTFAINECNIKDFAIMTPLFFGMDVDSIDFSKIKELTISADVILAKL